MPLDLSWLSQRPALTQRPELSADDLRSSVQEIAPTLAHLTHRPGLIWALVGDRVRDSGHVPLASEKLLGFTKDFGGEEWRRLWLAVLLMVEHAPPEVMKVLVPSAERVQPWLEGLIAFVGDTRLLSLPLLTQSRLRAEEFGRFLIGRMGANVEDEGEDASVHWLKRFNYNSLLDEAERARTTAQERLAYLQKLQDEQEAANAPRGKW